MRTFILLALVALLAFGATPATIQAQVFVIDQALKSASNLNYFQLKNSAGDSTNTLGSAYYTNGGGFGKITYTYTPVGGQKAVELVPDSIKLFYYSSNDSVCNVNFGMRVKYTLADSGTWSLIGVDTATTASGELQRRGSYTLTRATYLYAIPGGVAFGLKAAATGNCTGNATKGSTNATKIYPRIELYYTKP